MAKKTSKKTSKVVSKKTDITPLGDRVLVKPLTDDDLLKKSPSGIIIPETVDKEKPEQGKIVAVGEGRMNDDGKIIPVRAKVGDRIVFSKYGYDEVKIKDVEYYIIREENILAILN